jgi:type IV pilus assembly protein PilO
MADNPITRLPVAGQLLLSVVVAAVIFGGFWYFWWSPMSDEEDRKTKQLAALDAEIKALEVIRNRQQEFLREVETRKAKLELLKRILPADKETPELMKKVQYLATASNLNIRKFNPGPTVTKQFEVAPPPGQPAAGAKAPAKPAPRPAARPAAGGKPGAAEAGPPQDAYQEWPINVEIDGTYHNFGLFLDKVSRLSRLVNVGNVKIKNQAQARQGRTINVQCVATTYVYVEAPAQPAAAAGAAAPAPRRP